ncbi:MAG: beta-hydroxyacyl-ACP dehydratase [Acidobacteria bacterium]|nr:beta-hydroxyacyl-ACP dehydratase [Acidobacteriota bacterium]
MRWIWIDKFVEFTSCQSATAVKNVTLAEEHLHDHIPGFAVMPGSLMIEGMAQTGGILLGEKNAFRHIVILAKVPKMTFHGYVVPGDSIHYAATLTDERPEGGSVEVRATVGETLVAEGEIMFAHIAQNDPQFGNINQKNFVFNSGLMGVFEVGKA